MNNIKYYMLAYTKLTQLFLKKYLTLLYLLVKAQFTNKTGYFLRCKRGYGLSPRTKKFYAK